MFPVSFRSVSPLLRSFSLSSSVSLTSFLHETRSSLFNRLPASNSISSSNPPLVGVIGNEASDLDSMVSAVSLAWFLDSTQKFPQKTNFHLNEPAIYFPIINIARKDFNLRRDAVFTFENAGIPSSSLIFLDDFSSINSPFSLILVDHNLLSPSQSAWSSRIIGIIDHHVDSGEYLSTTDGRRLISPVGSCTSLVANWILSQHSDSFNLSPDISLPLIDLLLSAIGIDTSNAKNEKTKAADEEIFRELVRLNHELRLERIELLRESIEGLETREILIKDNKVQRIVLNDGSSISVNISSVPALVSSLVSRDPNFAQNCMKFMEENKFDGLMIMGLQKRPKPKRRQIFALVNRSNWSANFITGLQQSESLQLNSITDSPLESQFSAIENSKLNQFEWKFWNQENVNATRKQVAPIVADFASKL